jgi:MarR family
MHTRPPRHDDCFAVRQAARHISQLYERHLSAVQITPTQFSIVSALERMPDMTMAELAQAMVMERTTLVRVLQPLLRNGLVMSTLGGSSPTRCGTGRQRKKNSRRSSGAGRRHVCGANCFV